MRVAKLVKACAKTCTVVITSFVFSLLSGNFCKIDESGTSINWEEIKTGTGPIVFLVNGFGGCAPCMTPELKKKLRGKNISVYDLDWNNIYIRRRSVYSDLNDAKFIRQMVEEVIPAIAPSRPIILVGHSFGGDSLLKVAQKISPRRISFLAVLDGVNKKVQRTTEAVSPNVGYFYNRWTKYSSLAGGIPAIPIPGTSYYFGAPMNPRDSGEITQVSNLTCCNQKEQSYRFCANSLPIFVNHKWWDIVLTKLMFWLGSFVYTKHQRINHAGTNAIYQDAYIQQEMFDIIMQRLEIISQKSEVKSYELEII